MKKSSLSFYVENVRILRMIKIVCNSCILKPAVLTSKSGRTEKGCLPVQWFFMIHMSHKSLIYAYSSSICVVIPACNLSENSFKRFKYTRTNSCLKTFCSWCIPSSSRVLYNVKQFTMHLHIERHTCNTYTLHYDMSALKGSIYLYFMCIFNYYEQHQWLLYCTYSISGCVLNKEA